MTRNRKRQFLTTTHAGERLGVSPFRAAQLFDSGQLRGVRDSAGRRLITEKSVEDLAQRRKRRLVGAKALACEPAPVTP
jgi:predicted site-specific integrase-resolvase